jgi:hypothetical protein
MLESAIMALGEDFGSLQDKYTAIGLRRSSIKLARGKDHFLVRLDKIIDWQGFTPKLVEAYKGKACRSESPPRLHNDPLILFKMLLLAHLLNIGTFRCGCSLGWASTMLFRTTRH